MGKCVVIGLQSTGEARTVEALEREEELTDFVSTAKGVIQSLVEKHFPAPDRDKINRILGIGPKKSILDELGLKLPKNGSASTDNALNGKRKRKAAEGMAKKMKTEWDALGSSSEDEAKHEGSDYENEPSETPEASEDSDEDVNSDDFDDEDEDDYNPFGSGSEDDEVWAKRNKKKAAKKAKKTKKSKKNGSAAKSDPYAHLFPNR